MPEEVSFAIMFIQNSNKVVEQTSFSYRPFSKWPCVIPLHSFQTSEKYTLFLNYEFNFVNSKSSKHYYKQNSDKSN